MRKRPGTWFSAKAVHFIALWGLALLCALLFALQPQTAANGATVEQVSIQVEVGFEATYKSEYWTPVKVTLDNAGADFTGVLSARVYTGPPRSNYVSATSSQAYETPVSLRKNEHKQVNLYVPLTLGNLIPQGVTVDLKDQKGKVIANQSTKAGFEIKPGNFFIGILTDLNSGFDSIGAAQIPNQTSSLTTSFLNASTFPTQATGLDSLDIIVLDDFSSNTLNIQQLNALQTWVNQGGVLIEVGGPEWQQTLGTLPASLLPVTIDGTAILPAKTSLLPVGNNGEPLVGGEAMSNRLPEETTISTATLHQQASFSNIQSLLSQGVVPLIVQAQQGRGSITYLALDPARPPFTTWSGAGAFWRTILFHTMGERLLIPNTASTYRIGPGQLYTHGGILNMIAPEIPPGPWMVIILLFIYAFVLGPVRLFILRRSKYPQWGGWRFVAASVIVFSASAYGLVSYQRSASLIDNSISLVQVNQGGSTAHVTTFQGILTPQGGSFTLQLPAGSMAQPIAPAQLARMGILGSSRTRDDTGTFTTSPGGTQMIANNRDAWNFYPIVSEQETQLHGELTTHLMLYENRIVGTINNTLDIALNDAYILLPRSFISIGHIGAGESLHIDMPLKSAPLQSGKNIADYIAAASGVGTAYFPYTHNEQPQTDFQRHMALLSAMSGAGYDFSPCNGPCDAHAITSRDTIYLVDSHVPNPNAINTTDPLLIEGAPATLLAWMDDSGDSITVNGNHVAGRHESFLQMPLNFDIGGPISIPTDMIRGHIIEMQSYSAEQVLPGVYTMADGNVIFEFDLPNSTDLYINSMTIKAPDLLAHPFGPTTGQYAGVSYLQTALYNWYTGSWEKITLKQDLFSSNAPGKYIGPNGRVLMQVMQQKDYHGPLIFGKPSLSLQGYAAG